MTYEFPVFGLPFLNSAETATLAWGDDWSKSSNDAPPSPDAYDDDDNSAQQNPAHDAETKINVPVDNEYNEMNHYESSGPIQASNNNIYDRAHAIANNILATIRSQSINAIDALINTIADRFIPT